VVVDAGVVAAGAFPPEPAAFWRHARVEGGAARAAAGDGEAVLFPDAVGALFAMAAADDGGGGSRRAARRGLQPAGALVVAARRCHGGDAGVVALGADLLARAGVADDRRDVPAAGAGRALGRGFPGVVRRQLAGSAAVLRLAGGAVAAAGDVADRRV